MKLGTTALLLALLLPVAAVAGEKENQRAHEGARLFRRRAVAVIGLTISGGRRFSARDAPRPMRSDA